jgi:hypothetical protein
MPRSKTVITETLITMMGLVLVGYGLFGPGNARLVASPAVTIDISVFQDSLRPYGSWVPVPAYGEVWAPRGLAAAWRPYADGGHWVYTDDGWTWVSDYDWGWAAFHYGRWAYDPSYGWVWIPDDVWAPAWVAWRHGGDLIGWAPLPPAVRWQDGYGFNIANVENGIPGNWWSFVPEPDLLRPSIRPYLLPAARNVSFLRTTSDVTRYTILNNRIVNESIDVRHVEQLTGHPVPRYQVVPHDAPGRALVQGNQVRLYRPIASRTPAPIGLADLTRRQNAERQILSRSQTVEQQELSARHAREQQQAAQQAQSVQRQQVDQQRQAAQQQQAVQRQRAVQQSQADIRARQQQERQAQAVQHQQQVQAMQQRHEQERTAATNRGSDGNGGGNKGQRDAGGQGRGRGR